ncbi:hypothetical protein P12x_002834 [Tundrisphaera lichenicola]|uniref:hypothetical protein n=1 Tax=Tundrisphaera lichenicola TaxID=2029860 RepID=UPI003EB6D0E0
MTIRKQFAVVTLSALAVAMMGGLPLVAQEPANPKAESVPKKKQDRARRVPDYFGQIGLTEQQRGDIYSILGKRYEAIEALEKKIADEKAGMITECEGVLTDVQKKLLDNLRKAAAQPAAKVEPKPAAAKTAN